MEQAKNIILALRRVHPLVRGAVVLAVVIILIILNAKA